VWKHPGPAFFVSGGRKAQRIGKKYEVDFQEVGDGNWIYPIISG
jgi:hypothetical protein